MQPKEKFLPAHDLALYKVCVVGLGYVGLPTAALLATRGYNVIGLDTNPEIVSRINAGQIHIVEPELDILVKTAVESKRLTASKSPVAADVFIICVPTPINASDSSADLTYIRQSVQAILKVLKHGDLVLLESTSPPGTTQSLIGDVLEAHGFTPGDNVFVAYCPERVLPGAVIRELVTNDRTLGGLTPACADVAADFYKTYVQADVHKTSAKVAETVKLVENTSRDVQIAFANELSEICSAIDVDPWEVIRLANKHPRVKVLDPGPGVGGHCIAVDPWFLINIDPELAPLIKSARLANDRRPVEIAEKIHALAQQAGAKKVALLGMAYKPDIDDCRESPSLIIYNHLEKNYPTLELMVCEPNRTSLGDLPIVSLDTCLQQADLLAILVKHKEFTALDWSSISANKTVFDCKGVLTRTR